MLMFNLNRGSTISTPLFDHRCCNPLLAIAAMQGGANLLGNVLGGISAQKQLKMQQNFAQQQALQQHQWNEDDASLAYQRQQDFYNYQQSDQRAYDDPVAQRSRLENAGYNPFLTGTDAGNTTVGSSSVAMANPSVQNAVGIGNGNALSGLGQGISGAIKDFATTFSELAQARQQNTAAGVNQATSDRLFRQNDVITQGGHLVDAGYYQQFAEASNALQQSNLSQANATIQNMYALVQASQATDDSGQLLTNADGSVMTNMQYDEQLGQRNFTTNFSKMAAEIKQLSSQAKNIDLDSLVKKYNLKYIQPALLMQLHAEVDNLNSSTTLNYGQYRNAISSAFNNYADASLKRAFTNTENRMRNGRVREQNARAKGAIYDLPRQASDATWYSSPQGSAIRQGGRGLQDLNPFTGVFR